MTQNLAIALIPAAMLFVVLVVICAGLLKWFARPLTVSQALLVALFALGIATALLVVYSVAAAYLRIPRAYDSGPSIVWMLLAGTLMTRRARRYAIQKTGWLGVGAKVMLTVLALAWLVVLAGMAVESFH